MVEMEACLDNGTSSNVNIKCSNLYLILNFHL